MRLKELLIHHWKAEKSRMDKLNMSNEKITEFFEDTLHMLIAWVDLFCKKIHILQSIRRLFVQLI